MDLFFCPPAAYRLTLTRICKDLAVALSTLTLLRQRHTNSDHTPSSDGEPLVDNEVAVTSSIPSILIM